MKTVAQLRQDYKVFVKHRRYYQLVIDGRNMVVGPFTKKEAANYGYDHRYIHSKGGTTEIDIFKNGKLLASGGAICSLKDSFVRKIGLSIALGRTLERLDMINWTEIVNEVGQDRLRTFCEGGLTRREFEQSGTAARRVIRLLGIDEVRTRARKALNRRQRTS